MATNSTKMLDKQIATAIKNIDKIKANIERYKGLVEKKYAKLLKLYPNMSKYNFEELSDFTTIFGRDNWDLAYGYFDNLDSIKDNEKKLVYEQRHLESLQNEKSNKENSTKSYFDSTQELVNKFEELLKDYKQSYFDDCENKFAKLYNKMKAGYASAKAILKKANDDLPYFFGTYHSYKFSYIMKHYLDVREGMLGYYSIGTYNKKFIPFTEEECNLIEEWKNAYVVVHSDCQRFDTVDLYIEYKMKEVEMDWDSKIRTFADKCLKFGLNMDNVEFIVNNTSIKECEFMLKDDSSRVIYGRCIWAAEYSEVVTPHIRFIVTEKRYK
jgi:hypothetical protein